MRYPVPSNSRIPDGSADTIRKILLEILNKWKQSQIIGVHNVWSGTSPLRTLYANYMLRKSLQNGQGRQKSGKNTETVIVGNPL